jgi:hypothetical protein
MRRTPTNVKPRKVSKDLRAAVSDTNKREDPQKKPTETDMPPRPPGRYRIGAEHRAQDLDHTLQAILDYARFIWKIDCKAGPPGNIFWCIQPGFEAILQWEGRSEPVSYAEIVLVLHDIVQRLSAPIEGYFGEALYLTSLPVLPAQPRFFLALPLAVGEVSPEDLAKLLEEIKGFLDELWNKLDEEQRRKILATFLAVVSALKAARNARDVLAAVKALAEALGDLLKVLGYLGDEEIAKWAAKRILAFVMRLIGLGTVGGGGAAGGAGGFVLVDLLITLVLLALWALAWIKIGNWFWNRPVASSHQTYVDWWGDRFYNFYRMLAGKGCDELLDEFIQADRDLRGLESSGGDVAQVAIAAIHAGTIGNQLLKQCPTQGANPSIRRRIQHYEDKIKEFEKFIETK